MTRGGFPPEMNIQNDHTEDSDDAIIWMADIHLLRADTSAGTQTNTLAPWEGQWNFDAVDTSQWTTLGARKSRLDYAGGANQGPAYMYVEPTHPDQSWLIHSPFKIPTTTTSQGQVQQVFLGNNTGYQFEIAMRCPTWAPAYYGKNTSYCLLDVWLETKADPDGQAWRYTIAADGLWRFSNFDGWSAQVSDDDIELRFNTLGYPMDLDAIWVSSGL